MEEKFGTILIDGKMINVDELSKDELENRIKELEYKETKIREKIDKLLSE